MEIDLLDIQRGGFHDHLILIIVLKPIGILAVSTIGGTAGRFDIGHSPWFRAQGPEESGRVKRPGPHLCIIRLLNHTPLICPESLQCKNQFLEIHRFSLRLPCNGVAFLTLGCQPCGV
jgi:hypothetical protein